jgi:hypothetical protein
MDDTHRLRCNFCLRDCLLFVTHVRRELARGEVEQATATHAALFEAFLSFLCWSSQWCVSCLLVSTHSRLSRMLYNPCVSAACSPWLPTWERPLRQAGSMSANETRSNHKPHKTDAVWVGLAASLHLAALRDLFVFSLLVTRQACKYTGTNTWEALVPN